LLDRHYGLRAKEITSGEIKTCAVLSDRMKGVVRTDAEFLEGLRRARVSKTHLARYYLRAIELYRVKEPKPELGGIIEDTTTYNLELGPLSPRRFYLDCITATRGYSIGLMTIGLALLAATCLMSSTVKTAI
jgi:hypothetical protein